MNNKCLAVELTQVARIYNAAKYSNGKQSRTWVTFIHMIQSSFYSTCNTVCRSMGKVPCHGDKKKRGKCQNKQPPEPKG